MGQVSLDRKRIATPIGVAIDAAGSVFVLDAGTPAVFRLSASLEPEGASTDVQQDEKHKLYEVRDLQVSSGRDRLVIAQDQKVLTVNVMVPGTLKSEGSFPARDRRDRYEVENVRSATLFGGPSGIPAKVWVLDDGGAKAHIGNLLKIDTTVDKTLGRAREVVASVAGLLFVCDTRSGTVRVFHSDGAPLTKISDKAFPEPADLALDDYGRVFVHDAKSGRIVELE
jgi:streptogramin lyase